MAKAFLFGYIAYCSVVAVIFGAYIIHEVRRYQARTIQPTYRRCCADCGFDHAATLLTPSLCPLCGSDNTGARA